MTDPIAWRLAIARLAGQTTALDDLTTAAKGAAKDGHRTPQWLINWMLGQATESEIEGDSLRAKAKAAAPARARVWRASWQAWFVACCACFVLGGVDQLYWPGVGWSWSLGECALGVLLGLIAIAPVWFARRTGGDK